MYSSSTGQSGKPVIGNSVAAAFSEQTQPVLNQWIPRQNPSDLIETGSPLQITRHDTAIMKEFSADTVYIAGHRGMVGLALYRLFQEKGVGTLLSRTHGQLDLTDQTGVRTFLGHRRIDHIILAAAKVGGIYANNTYPAEFIYSNLMIQTNIIHEAYCAGVHNLLFLGSSCIYPKYAPQPMKEEHLLTGELEPTNEPYAIAKIAGIKMCESYNRQYGTSFRSVMPTNLYGPGDNYHLQNSHVIPAMIRKYHLAKLALRGDAPAISADIGRYGPLPDDIGAAIGYSPKTGELKSAHAPKVILWGTGAARREFLHVNDMADACLHVMALEQKHFQGSNPSFVNIGYGSDIPIREVARMVAKIVGFEGETVFDSSKPDGTPRKLLDSSRIRKLGWQPKYSLEEGIRHAYASYIQEVPANLKQRRP